MWWAKNFIVKTYSIKLVYEVFGLFHYFSQDNFVKQINELRDELIKLVRLMNLMD